MSSRRFGLGVLAGAIVAFSSSPAEARGRIPIPIVYHYGDSLKQLGEVAEAYKEDVAEATGKKPKVGFLYKSCGVFRIDFWTWDGKFCLYEDDAYWELNASEAARLLDKSSGKHGKPWSYSYPPGLVGLLLLAAICTPISVARRRKRMRQQKEFVAKFNELMEDRRYQQALEIVQREVEQLRSKAEPSADEAVDQQATDEQPVDDQAVDEQRPFKEGVRYLTSQGVPHDEAEHNLGMVISVLAAHSEQADGEQ